MDRPSRVLLAGRLALMAGGVLLCAEGCRSTRSEVPPGKPYQTTGGAPPSVGFSSEPHPNPATGMAGLHGNMAPGSLVQDGRGPSAPSGDMVYGTPTQGTPNLGAPTDNRYGPPGTAGSSTSSPSGSASIADSLLKSMPPVSKVLAKDPETTPVSGTSSPGGAYP